MQGDDPVERLVTLLARLPGLGPRSARRGALALIDHKDTLMRPLAEEMALAAERVVPCSACGNHSLDCLCHICRNPERNPDLICVVATVADLWAMERAGVFSGQYHVLGGTLSAVGNVTPDDLRIPELVKRVSSGNREVILALNATFDGQTTAHYIADRLADLNVVVTRIRFGVPIGGELDYLDGDTIAASFDGRGKA